MGLAAISAAAKSIRFIVFPFRLSEDLWPARLVAWSASLRNHADSGQNRAGLAISRQISVFSCQPRSALVGHLARILGQRRADGVLGGGGWGDADHDGSAPRAPIGGIGEKAHGGAVLTLQGPQKRVSGSVEQISEG